MNYTEQRQTIFNDYSWRITVECCKNGKYYQSEIKTHQKSIHTVKPLLRGHRCDKEKVVF